MLINCILISFYLGI